ncbi:MAG: hypothetical protein AB7S93_08465 [Xanthobacteraceae bacterium]
MDPQTIEITIKAYLTEMRSRLEEAASIAKAAEACALSGHVEKGIEVALDVELSIGVRSGPRIGFQKGPL